MATNKYVTINVYADGDFNYSFAKLGVSAGDVVTWNAGPDTGAFGITFRPATPLTTGGATLESGGLGNTIVGTVQANLNLGDVYYYTVWADYQPTGKRWTDGCPELIIRPQ